MTNCDKYFFYNEKTTFETKSLKIELQENIKRNISYLSNFLYKALFLRYMTNCDKYFFYNEKTTFETKIEKIKIVAKIH